ncbi:MAG: DUF92 domain-containing protein [Chitinophagaceae bacterium]|nr:MAG: DUF92 domain-containing protein [Chitinophagaceae bacterium]
MNMVAEGLRKFSTLQKLLANGGLAGLFGFVAILYPQYRDLMLILIASSISAASADTISSELGSLYGRRFFNIMTFRPDRRGENGVVSLEGFAFGLLGSCLVAITYGLTEKFNLSTLLIIVVAGSIGNLVDSVLGATLERKGQLKNDSVNFLNTVGAAVVAFMVMQF